MSDQERPRSRSASRSPRQDSWYVLVQEEVLVSSPTPSPRRSLTSSGSRSSSKASSVSSTPRPLQTTSSSTATAEHSPGSLLQSTTLSQHPLDETAALTQYPLEESLDDKQGPTGNQSKREDAHLDVISPLGGLPDSNEAGPMEQFALPPLNLDASFESQDGEKFKGLAKGTFPFVEEDDSAAMSSDTDIPIHLSDNDDNESGFPEDMEGFGLSKDAVQEAIAEVSADFVSGVLSMSVSQHSVDGNKGEYERRWEDNVGAADIQSKAMEDAHSSAATTPWQSEGAMEQPTPSPFDQENIEFASDQIPRDQQMSRQSHASSTNRSISPGSNRTKSSMTGSIKSEISSERNASPTLQLKPSAEDMTRGSPSKLPLDLDSLQPLDIGEHMASGADVVVFRGSGDEYLPETNRFSQATQRHQERLPGTDSMDARSMAEDRNQMNADSSGQHQRVSLERDARESLPSQYLSPSEGNTSRDAQSYIHYPRDLQGSPRNIGFSSDNDSTSADMQQGGARNTRDANVSQARRDQGSERDLLARRVALLLQVNSDMEAHGRGSGSLSGSGSSSHTGSPDSIEEATLPLGILSKDSHGSPSSYRRGDGQSLPPASRSESSESSNTDSLAEHVKRLLQESESMRKLHAAGIDPQQLLSIQTEIGKSSPTLSDASTSSSVRDIVNRVVRHSRAGSESDDSVLRPQEAYISPSMGSSHGRSRNNSGHQEGNKVTFQDTFQANRSQNGARSGNTSHSSTSTLTNDSLSHRVQHLLSLADDTFSHQPEVASESLSREDLLALVQIAELEKKINESRSTSQRQGSPRSSQNSRMSATRDAVSRSTSAKDNSVASTDSLALRVQAILGREAPGERVDRIISEALSVGDPSIYDRNLSDSSLDGKYTSANSQRISSVREFEDPATSDVTQRPFGAFDRARDMLTLHLQRLEERTFDHSVDTRTPLRHDNNANMIVNRAEYDALTRNSSQQLSEHDFHQTPSSGSLSKPISTDHVFYGLLPEQIPSHLQMSQDQSAGEFHLLQSVDSPPARPKSWTGDPRQLYPRYQSSGRYQHENENMPPDQDSQVMDDSLFAMQRSNSSPEMKVDKRVLPEAKATSSSGSWGRTNQFQDMQQQQASRIPSSKLPVLSRNEAKQGQKYPSERQQEYHSPPGASQTPKHLPSQQHRQVHPDYSTNSWPRSLSKSRSGASPTARQETSPRSEQRQSFGKDSSATEGFLKPYRPPGSSDVIYTYTVDGQTVDDPSPSRSISTLESSHAGSNDANAPSFPNNAYGSRPNKDSIGTSPHSSKIPRFDRGHTSPVRSPHERSRGQTLIVDDQKESRSYGRSLSESSRQEQTREKEKVGRQISLSPQHRPGRSRTSGVKREHSRSPPESVPYAQMPPYNPRQAFEMETGRTLPTDGPVSGHPVIDRAVSDHGGVSGQESRERFGYRVQPRPLSWDASGQGQPMDYRGAYPQDTQYRQQYGIPSGMAPAPPVSASDVTSPSKIPRFRPGSEQPPLRYMPVGAERAERRYPDRQYQEYGEQGVPQLPGTYSRQVLEDILQNESDPLYREASLMWDQYQRLQQQKEARREARREVKGQGQGQDESDVSSLDSRRVARLAHLVQDPVQHTVQHFVQDETDSRDSSSTTLTDASTPRQRRKWERDQRGFTPREQSPDKIARNGEFQRKISPEEIAAIVQRSPTKESRIPKASTRQSSQQHDKRNRRDEKHSSKRSPEQEQMESRGPLDGDITQEALSSVLTSTEETLLTDMSLESDRLLELLGPDGIRKLSSKLVKLQRKIDRQREHHRKRTEEQNGAKPSAKSKGHRQDVPISSTPAVDDLSLSATSSNIEEVSDIVGSHLRVGKQASLEPALSPVQEAFRSTEDSSVYDTAESTPPEATIPDRKDTRQGRINDNGQTAKRREDFAHCDDFEVTYNTDSFSDVGSDTSVPCACKPKRSHSIHGITSTAREHATDNMSKETKPDAERDDVFKKPSKGLSRIPVRDSDSTSRNGSATGPAQDTAQKMKPGTAFVIDVGRGDKEAGKDTVLTGKQNYNNKDLEEEGEERRRRRNEKKADKQIPAKENEAPSRIPKKIVQPVAWFQPLAKKMPWQQDTPTKAKPQPMSFPVKEEETAPKPGDKAVDKASLQDAFEKYRSDFISKSRERQRKMRLAAEERHTQAQFDLERAQIFHDQRSKKPNPNAHPLSDQLHKPKKRALSKKQMKEQTEKLYNRLPEVKQKEKEKRKVQDSNLNRIRAQMYRKKLSDKVKGKPFPGS